ncbi:MAG: DnaJ C-terminal domain-containing protein [Pseudomonadota bacterium]
MSNDPYTLLGVPRTANDDDIKKAYRAKVKALHPDLHPDDPAKAEQFKHVSRAFDILGDRQKRARFNRGEIDGEGNERASPFGPGGTSGYAGAGTARGHAGSAGMGGEPFDDILSGLFGQGRGRRRTGPARGRDIRYTITIPFEDAVTGGKRRLTMADGKTLDVDIPAGVEDGVTLKLRSQGQPSPSGGPPGDGLIDVRITPSQIWTREGDDLRMTMPVSLETVVLGGKIDVRTPTGMVTMKVPPGSNTGTVLRLKEKGVQIRNRPGSLFVRLEIVLDDPGDAGLRDFLDKRRR